MRKLAGAASISILAAIASGPADAACASYTQLQNGQVADASQVMANFNAVLNGPCFSGNVGIGTTAPDQPLTVSGSLGGRGVHVKSTTGAGIELDRATISNAAFFSVATSGSSDWDIGEGIYSGGGSDFSLGRDSGSAATLTISYSSGDVGIGTAAPGYTLQVNGSVAGNSAYNNLSDARLKKNVAEIVDAVALVDKLRGVRFVWRKPAERAVGKTLNLPVDEPQVGFIAQEVKPVLPEAVTQSKEGIYSIEESKIVPVLVEAVKALKAADDRQQEQIALLRQENAALKDSVDRELAAVEHRLAAADRKPERRVALQH